MQWGNSARMSAAPLIGYAGIFAHENAVATTLAAQDTH